MSRTIFEAPIDSPAVVRDRRDGERDEDPRAVGAHPLGFEMIDPLPGLEAGDDPVFLADAIRRNHQRDVAPDRLVGAIAEEPLGAAFQVWMMPSSDLLMMASSDDSTMEASSRAACKLVRVFVLEPPRVADVAKDQDAARHVPRLVPDGCGAVVDRALAPILSDEQRVVREADDDPFAERPVGGAFHRLAGSSLMMWKTCSSGCPSASAWVHPVSASATALSVATRPEMSVVMTASPMLCSVTRRTSRRWLARAWARRIASRSRRSENR